MFRWLKSVYWLSSMSYTKGVLTDCLLCIVPEMCSLINNIKIWFWFWFLKSVYWLSNVSCTQRVLNVCLICEHCVWRVFIDSLMVLCNEMLRVFTDFINYGTWRVFTDCPCFTVPEEGKLIKYSHQMNEIPPQYSHQMNEIPPSKKGILSFSEFSKSADNFFMVRYLKSVYWLSSVSCTQRVLNVCLICDVLEGCSLMVLCNEILRVFTNFVNHGTWRVFTDWPYCTVHEEDKLIKYSYQMFPPPKRNF